MTLLDHPTPSKRHPYSTLIYDLWSRPSCICPHGVDVHVLWILWEPEENLFFITFSWILEKISHHCQLPWPRSMATSVEWFLLLLLRTNYEYDDIVNFLECSSIQLGHLDIRIPFVWAWTLQRVGYIKASSISAEQKIPSTRKQTNRHRDKHKTNSRAF